MTNTLLCLKEQERGLSAAKTTNTAGVSIRELLRTIGNPWGVNKGVGSGTESVRVYR